MELAFIPLAIFLFIIGPKSWVYALFYNKTTKEWEGKRWQYYTAYTIFNIIFFFLCSFPFITDTYMQIYNFFRLETGNSLILDRTNEEDKYRENLPDNEFLMVYEIKKNTSPEEIINDILPQIIEYQGNLSDWCSYLPHFNDYRIENYHIRYNIEKKIYELYLDQAVAAEIEVKNTPFFKKIYFHGYLDVYKIYQNSPISSS